MSDSQVYFSTAISNVSPEEKAWLEALLKDKAEQNGDVGFEWSFEQAPDDSTYLHIHTDTVFGGDIEQVAEFTQAFLAEWRPDGIFRVEYASVDTDHQAFGGGAVVITATGQRWFNTHQMLMLGQDVISDAYVQELDPRQSSFGLVEYIKIRRFDEKPMSWSEVWAVFSDSYPGRWAMQFFPPAGSLVDHANIYHLFVLPEAPNGIDIKQGWYTGD